MPAWIENPDPDAAGTFLIIPEARHQGLDVHSIALLVRLARKYKNAYSSGQEGPFWCRVRPLFDWLSAKICPDVHLITVFNILLIEYRAGFRFYSNYSDDHRRPPRYDIDHGLAAFAALNESRSEAIQDQTAHIDSKGRPGLPMSLNNDRL